MCRWDIILKEAVTGAKNPKAVANWIINNLRAKLTEYNDRISKDGLMNEFLEQNPGTRLVALSADAACKGKLPVVNQVNAIDFETRRAAPGLMP